MVLENEKCIIRIETDDTYAINSTDNRYYDAIYDLYSHKYGSYTTFSIEIDLFFRSYRIALVGSFYSRSEACAILDGETLTVLQDYAIVQIDVMAGTIVRSVELDCEGCNFSIHRAEKGYVLYGELEITMLDFEFVKKWSFSGGDIFVSASGKTSFAMTENAICLYDFEDNYYEIDFNGNLIR